MQIYRIRDLYLANSATGVSFGVVDFIGYLTCDKDVIKINFENLCNIVLKI